MCSVQFLNSIKSILANVRFFFKSQARHTKELSNSIFSLNVPFLFEIVFSFFFVVGFFSGWVFWKWEKSKHKCGDQHEATLHNHILKLEIVPFFLFYIFCFHNSHCHLHSFNSRFYGNGFRFFFSILPTSKREISKSIPKNETYFFYYKIKDTRKSWGQTQFIWQFEKCQNIWDFKRIKDYLFDDDECSG